MGTYFHQIARFFIRFVPPKIAATALSFNTKKNQKQLLYIKLSYSSGLASKCILYFTLQ